MRVLLAALVLFALVALPVLAIMAEARRRPTPSPPRDLAQAARLLDQVRAWDDASGIPQLPFTLRKDLDAFVNRYYKEIGS